MAKPTQLPNWILLSTALLCASPTIGHAQGTFEVVRVLLGGTDPKVPTSLLQATDGNFYGLMGGGAFAKGAIVRVTAAGVATILHSFTDSEGRPNSYLEPDTFFQATDSNFYGATSRIVFRMSLAGEFSTLHTFGGNSSEDMGPVALLESRDGYFYGVTRHGGIGCYDGCGTFFRMTPTGDTTVLFQFPGTNDFSYPDALLQAVDGDFYGTANGRLFRVTPTGALSVVALPGMVLKLQGTDGNFYGTSSRDIFSVTPAGSVRRLYSFNSGYLPRTLIQAGDGNFYGTRYGYDSDYGNSDYGALFRMTPAGDVTILHDFRGTPDGSFPVSFFQGRDGAFYGATKYGGVFGPGSVFTLQASGAGFAFIKSFSFGAEGQSPLTALVRGNDGNFYGTTPYGGPFSTGTIFKVTPAGVLTVLEFVSSRFGLTKGPDNAIYGATTQGGAFGRGRIFRITSSGVLASVHDFTQWESEGPDNGSLRGNLVFGPDGSLYGANWRGVVFRVTPEGTFTPVATGDFASLVFATDGNLYAVGGVAGDRISRISLDGTVTLLHIFNRDVEGFFAGTLIQSHDGNFYGFTTVYGPFGRGTAFRISPDGAFAVLQAFGLTSNDSIRPSSALIEASDGNFYGAASPVYGVDGGRIYRMTPQGVLTILHTFEPFGTGGYGPSGGLTEDEEGNLYGVTYGGGPSGAGVIFRLNFHRAPPAAPSLVRVAPAANKGVRLSWSRPLGATSFAIKRTLGNGSYVVVASGLTDASYVDTAVTSGQGYHYVVTAFNEMGEGVGSYDVAITAGRSVRGDLDGDGMTDLVWRHTSGAVTIWQMRDFSVIGGGHVANVDLAWAIAGRGDFNGDGRADLLWRHTSGAVTVWFMDGTSVIGGGLIASVDPTWAIVATNDFNGDGRDDLAWRHTTSGELLLWWMNGTQVIGGGALPAVDPRWTIAGTGDFDGDGRADLLWRHSASHDVTLWLLDGTRVVGGGALGGIDAVWQIAGVSDHNGDGRADILWRRTTGDVTVWLMDGAQVIGGGPTQPFAEVDPAWQIVATGDYTGDGRADILWRDAAGTVSVWFMDGRQAIGGAEVGKVDPAWQLVTAP